MGEQVEIKREIERITPSPGRVKQKVKPNLPQFKASPLRSENSRYKEDMSEDHASSQGNMIE